MAEEIPQHILTAEEAGVVATLLEMEEADNMSDAEASELTRQISGSLPPLPKRKPPTPTALYTPQEDFLIDLAVNTVEKGTLDLEEAATWTQKQMESLPISKRGELVSDPELDARASIYAAAIEASKALKKEGTDTSETFSAFLANAYGIIDIISNEPALIGCLDHRSSLNVGSGCSISRKYTEQTETAVEMKPIEFTLKYAGSTLRITALKKSLGVVMVEHDQEETEDAAVTFFREDPPDLRLSPGKALVVVGEDFPSIEESRVPKTITYIVSNPAESFVFLSGTGDFCKPEDRQKFKYVLGIEIADQIADMIEVRGWTSSDQFAKDVFLNMIFPKEQ